MSGTTFLALGNYNLEEQDKKQLRMDVVDEQLDVRTALHGLLKQLRQRTLFEMRDSPAEAVAGT